MSAPPSVAPTPRTNVSGLTTVAPLPEVEAVQEILMTMKGALGALGVSLFSLCEFLMGTMLV